MELPNNDSDFAFNKFLWKLFFLKIVPFIFEKKERDI